MEWIDIHTHLNFLEGTPEEAIQRARQVGVERMITIGTEPEDHSIVLDLARKFSPHVFCTLGVHPHEAKKYDDLVETFLRKNLPDRRVVAVAEIGLDYYYDSSPRDVQRDVFRRQLELACEFDLPIEIHTRDAEEDTVKILKEFSGRVRGVIHCFTGTQYLADEALALGYNISFSGIVTFRSAESLREVLKTVPLDRLHVETDAPYLAPVPHRGKKNEPAFVVDTAKLVAEIKGVSLQELCDQTRANALAMFPKLVWIRSPQEVQENPEESL